MEASSCSSNPPKEKGKGKGTKCRRVWNQEEELVLLHALNELKGRGLKVDNAFKAGYLLQLEAIMLKALPDTDIRGDPQIRSKLTVWKRTYGHLYSLFDGSGGGASLNKKTLMIEVVSEDFWKEYVRVHPYVASYRMKRFPYFDEWAEIFGKDRATGVGAEDISAAVQELINNLPMHSNASGQTTGPNVSSNSEHQPIDLDAEGEGDNNMQGPGPSKVDAKMLYKKIKREKGTKKRKCSTPPEVVAPECPPYMDEFIKKTQDSIDRLTALVVDPQAREDPASQQRKSLFSALEEIPDLDEEQRLSLAHKLAHSPEDLDLFFTMPFESKPKYLRMLLRKKSTK